MSTPTPSLQELAEEPDHFINDLPAPARRIITPRFTVVLSPSLNQSATSRLRTTADALDETIADVRHVLRESGHTRNVWQLGPSCRPEGISQLLRARGFAPPTGAPFEPAATAMALSRAPHISAVSAGVTARLVRNVDEYREVMRIAMAAFNESPEDAAGWYEAVPTLWAAHDGVSRYTYMAFLDERAVGFGFATTCGNGVLLGGSGVLEEARGRGVYRALVAGRWEEAVRLGKDGLVIHAGSMSLPILQRCGFETVCSIEMLEDVAFSRAQGAG